MRQFATILLLLATSALLTACNISTPDNLEPTVEVLITNTPTQAVSDTPTPSLTPSSTPTPQDVVDIPVIVATPVPIDNMVIGEPTQSLEPTPTLTPWIHIVREGETLGAIMQFQPWGYPPFDPAVMNAILNANGLATANQLRVGQELVIPFRTATPIPEGIELTQAAAAERGVEVIGNQEFVAGQLFGPHVVQEGQTVVGIMELYDTTLEVLSQQNPNLGWTGCDFTNPSGGPNCAPNIGEGQEIKVPLPTPTRAPTATPSGNETPTPTPTYPPARTFYPPNGVIVSGSLTAQWTSLGILQPNEVYLVEIIDRTTGNQQVFSTTATAYPFPTSLIPRDGVDRSMEWRVRAGRDNGDGTYSPIGGAGNWRTFTWRSS